MARVSASVHRRWRLRAGGVRLRPAQSDLGARQPKWRAQGQCAPFRSPALSIFCDLLASTGRFCLVLSLSG
eukprot:753099-Pleurochrysis_carterae.AAC.2